MTKPPSPAFDVSNPKSRVPASSSPLTTTFTTYPIKTPSSIVRDNDHGIVMHDYRVVVVVLEREKQCDDHGDMPYDSCN